MAMTRLPPRSSIRGHRAGTAPHRAREPAVGGAVGAAPDLRAAQRGAATPRLLSAGTLSVGDPVVSLPAARVPRSRSTHLTTTASGAAAPLSVSIELADDIDVGRGDVFGQRHR